jgi:hypothetical protein
MRCFVTPASLVFPIAEPMCRFRSGSFPSKPFLRRRRASADHLERGGNGVIKVLVDGGKGVRNRERRAALARASGLLKQLADAIEPLAAGGEEGVAEPLQTLFDWLREQRERATPAARSIAADGARE